MARIRTVKPEFWQDEKLSPLTPIDRLVFLGLVSQADDSGRLVDSVKLLNGMLFPHTDDDCGESLQVLDELGVVERGLTKSGQAVIQIVGWEKHQRIDKPNLAACLPAISMSRARPAHQRRVPPKLREAIYERDGGVCRACGVETHLDKGHPRYGGDDTLAEIDHILALADGGCNDPSNLQLLCKKCNRGKAGKAFKDRNIDDNRGAVVETSGIDPGSVGDKNGTDQRPDLRSTIPEQRSTIGDQRSSTNDQKLKFRLSELETAEIEENGFVRASEIPSVGAFLAGLNESVATKEALDFEDISYTLNAFFPPVSPGAGTNPAIKAWLGRIPEQTIGSALRYLHTQTYIVEGEEKTWGQLTDDHCKRLITAGLNAILRERG